jgi:SAM-dependent methyltransferase
VVGYDADADGSLPFDDDSLDLVMSRHERVDAGEVARVLAPGGILLSQQVDGRDAEELRDWFGDKQQYPKARLDVEREAAERAGLVVDVAEEWAGRMEFADVEALVTYMALVPWNVPQLPHRRPPQETPGTEAGRPATGHPAALPTLRTQALPS